jgi:Lon-like protease
MTVAYYTEHDSEPPRARIGRGWVTWSAFAVLIAVVFGASLVPTDYVVEQPGPTYNTLSTVLVDGDPVPLIDIPMAEVYPTTGSLSMLTVSTVGNRDSRVSWFRAAQTWFDPSQDLVPLDDIYPVGVTTEQSDAISQAQMTQSQDAAVAAALHVLGYEYETRVSVVSTVAGGPADGQLLADDVISTVNGEPVDSVDQLKQLLTDNGTTDPATVVVRRDGADVSLDLTPQPSDTAGDAPVLGIGVTLLYTFPIDVTVELSGVGGPSAGQMFALAIIDKLTPGALTGGLDIAGTGTITPDGIVGPIGGIKQKMYGAARAGADYFLAPIQNCNEVVGNIPAGLTVFPVTTLADSISVLNTLASGGSTSLLTRCTAE